MAKKNNRICIVCSKEYRYCNTCAEDRKKEPWHSIYCSNNCKDIFYAASSYYSNASDKDAIKERFDSCDLSYKDKLHSNIIEAINAVYDIAKTKDIKVADDETILETVNEISVESAEQEDSATKMKYGKYTKKK